MAKVQQIVVNEVYSTITGEGPNVGKPTVVVRLFGSNYVDRNDIRPFASNPDPEHRATNARNILIDDLMEEINKTKGPKDRLLIVGGETMLQQEAIVAFLERFETWFNRKPFVELQTSGTIMPMERLIALVDHFSVALRLANATNSNDRRATVDGRIFPDIIKTFLATEKVSFITYLRNAGGIQEVEEIMAINAIPNDLMWVSYAPTNPMEAKRAGVEIAKSCIAKSFNFSPRLHVSLFDAKRGF